MVIGKSLAINGVFWIGLVYMKLHVTTLGKEYNLKTWEDWYTIKRTDIVENGGLGLLSHFDNSLPQTICKVYPEYPWILSKFTNVTEGV